MHVRACVWCPPRGSEANGDPVGRTFLSLTHINNGSSFNSIFSLKNRLLEVPELVLG